MSKLRNFMAEWRSRRAGRRHVPNDVSVRARDVVGYMGVGTSRAWTHIDSHNATYARSFGERPLPPSLHVSSRDQVRAGEVMPLVERCIEDYADPEAEAPRHWSTEELREG